MPLFVEGEPLNCGANGAGGLGTSAKSEFCKHDIYLRSRCVVFRQSRRPRLWTIGPVAGYPNQLVMFRHSRNEKAAYTLVSTRSAVRDWRLPKGLLHAVTGPVGLELALGLRRERHAYAAKNVRTQRRYPFHPKANENLDPGPIDGHAPAGQSWVAKRGGGVGLRILRQAGRPFHGKLDSDSGGSWSPVPGYTAVTTGAEVGLIA